MTWELNTWVQAWGRNLPLICNGINEPQIKLPRLPAFYDWLLTRELTGEHPTYRLALLQSRGLLQPYRLVARGKIDKKMYGEAGVQQLARAFMERNDISEPEQGTERTTRARRSDRSALGDQPGGPERQAAAGD